MPGKRFDWKVEGSKFIIAVDPNADGEPVLELKIDIAEVPDEVLSLFAKKAGA